MYRAAAACAAVLAAVCVLACGGATGRKTYSREEFHAKFMGATLDEVRAALGAPDEVDVPNGAWKYRNRTRDRAGAPDPFVTLQHLDGRVTLIAPAPEK